MSKKTYFAATATAFIAAASISTVALAWHPEGKITKEVRNVTLNSAYADANDAGTAISARPGDTLSYRMTVINPAQPAEQQWHDLAFISVSDTLPSGVTLASGAKDMAFSGDVVVPQATATGKKSVSYEFTVKVDANAKDGQLICNTAKFTGNSITKDAPRDGQDTACVKVTVPPAPKQIQVCDLNTKQIVTITEDQFNSAKYSKDLSLCTVKPVIPTTPVTPTTPATPETPAPLPSTGPSALFGALAVPGLSGLAYGAVSLIQRRK